MDYDEKILTMVIDDVMKISVVVLVVDIEIVML
jgi:hypothetical protein